MPRLPLPIVALLLPLLSAAPCPVDGKGPAIGSIAPEPGLRAWLRRPYATPGTLAELRGRVVLLHTFAWNCGSCLKVGIPLVVDLVEADAERGLTAFSITTPAAREETEEVLERFGVRHAVAIEAPMGSQNPYVDVSVNPVTYLFVIGRSGQVAWRGDPSTHEEECLEALARALDEPEGRALPRPLHAELDGAVALYFAGRWSEARRAAEKLQRRHERRKGGDSPTIAADAALLVGHVDALGAALLTGLEEALARGDAPAVVRAREEIEGRLPKTEVCEQAGALLERLEEDEALAEQVEEAAAWRALAAARPALFPVRDDRPGAKFAKALRRYVDEHPGSPYRPTAEAWLTAWEGRRERD